MNYSSESSHVRVDFFQQSGKWYATEEVVWMEHMHSGVPLHDAFKAALREHFKSDPYRLRGMIAVCLDPYHHMGLPLMLVNGWAAPEDEERS